MGRVKRSRPSEVLMLAASGIVVAAAVAVNEARSPSSTTAPGVASASALSSLPSGAPASSVVEPPADEEDRGCAIADRGLGEYVEKGSLPLGKLFVRSGAVDADGDYTLLLHLHGGQAARKLVLPENLDLEMLVVDRGVGSSAYEGTFPSRKSWDELLGRADRAVSDAVGRPAHAEAVVVSSWSAGYRGVDDVLGVAGRDPALRGVILLDSLHASYPNGRSSLEHGQLERFVDAARRAASDKTFFFHVTHSEIRPPGYASTTETASLLLSELGIEASMVNEGGRDLLPLTRVADDGQFAVRGYVGSDARAHCDQLRLLPSILAAHSLR